MTAPAPLKSRALRYLAAREYSRAELAARLARPARAGEDEATLEAIERVLDELAAKGFIDEARVAESVLHRRAARLGGARVLHELRAKGLPEASYCLRGLGGAGHEPGSRTGCVAAPVRGAPERSAGARPPTALSGGARLQRRSGPAGVAGRHRRGVLSAAPARRPDREACDGFLV